MGRGCTGWFWLLRELTLSRQEPLAVMQKMCWKLISLLIIINRHTFTYIWNVMWVHQRCGDHVLIHILITFKVVCCVLIVNFYDPDNDKSVIPNYNLAVVSYDLFSLLPRLIFSSLSNSSRVCSPSSFHVGCSFYANAFFPQERKVQVLQVQLLKCSFRCCCCCCCCCWCWCFYCWLVMLGPDFTCDKDIQWRQDIWQTVFQTSLHQTINTSLITF